MINNVLVSGVQQSDSVIHIYVSILFFFYVSILFQILFPFRLLQSIEQSSLCYTAGLLLVIYFIFLFIKNCLEYDCLTMLCYLLQYSKANQLYMYIYPSFLDFLAI